MNTNIVKLYLYAYPELEALASASETAAANRAVLSFRAVSALRIAESVAEEYAWAHALASLKGALDEIFYLLTAEERALIGYKYFFARDELELACSERSYFRRQAALVKRVAALLALRGWTQERFFREFSGYAPFVRVYRALSAGKEFGIRAKRQRRNVIFHGSGGSGDTFLPRMTKPAQTTAATHAMQMTAISAAESPPPVPAAPPSPPTAARKSSLRSKESSSSAGI